MKPSPNKSKNKQPQPCGVDDSRTFKPGDSVSVSYTGAGGENVLFTGTVLGEIASFFLEIAADGGGKPRRVNTIHATKLASKAARSPDNAAEIAYLGEGFTL